MANLMAGARHLWSDPQCLPLLSSKNGNRWTWTQSGHQNAVSPPALLGTRMTLMNLTVFLSSGSELDLQWVNSGGEP